MASRSVRVIAFVVSVALVGCGTSLEATRGSEAEPLAGDGSIGKRAKFGGCLDARGDVGDPVWLDLVEATLSVDDEVVTARITVADPIPPTAEGVWRVEVGTGPPSGTAFIDAERRAGKWEYTVVSVLGGRKRVNGRIDGSTVVMSVPLDLVARPYVDNFSAYTSGPGDVDVVTDSYFRDTCSSGPL